MPKQPKTKKEPDMSMQEQDPQVGVPLEVNGNAESGERSRVTRSTREWIDSDGNVVDTMNAANGIRFTLVGGKSWDYQHGQFPFADRCFAIFGAPTKIGNVANTVFNPPKVNGVRIPGSLQEAEAEIDSFLQDLFESEIWIAEGQTTGRGLDKPTMARAAINLAVAAGKVKDTPEARGEAEQRQLEKFESDKKYWGKIRENHEVKAEYVRLAGGTMRSAVDVLEL